MPKMKTHRGAAKRFRATGTGKLMRRRAFRTKHLQNKASTRMRRLDNEVVIENGDHDKIRKLLGR